MDDTNRPNFHLPAFSNATTVNNSTYDRVPSPTASPSANTFDPQAGATYFHYNSDGTIISKPMGKTAATNNSNTAQQTTSSPTRDPATSTSSSDTDLATLKTTPPIPQNLDPLPPLTASQMVVLTPGSSSLAPGASSSQPGVLSSASLSSTHTTNPPSFTPPLPPPSPSSPPSNSSSSTPPASSSANSLKTTVPDGCY
ncbi:MAG: hypothetical protein Q9198_009799 [Flavoplaca austrocitrina]